MVLGDMWILRRPPLIGRVGHDLWVGAGKAGRGAQVSHRANRE